MRYIFLRTLESLLLLAGATLALVVMLRALPGDPAELILGEFATPQSLASLRESLGLNTPWYEQYVNYLGDVIRGDFGVSLRSHQEVLPYVMQRLPATLELTTFALVVTVLVSFPLGMFAALRRNTWVDRLLMGVALLGQATPGFWLGLMLIAVFAVQFNVLPSSGYGDSGLDRLKHLILPGVTLSAFMIGLLIRLVRSGMIDVITQDYIRTARAKGLTERKIIVVHAMKNALIPIITILGLQVGTLLGGAVITEAVFAWPGIGSLMITSISQRDYPVVQAIVLMMAAAFIVINWIVNISYHYLDPRV